MRVAANSDITMSALDGKERTQQMADLKYDRKIANRDLKRTVKKLAKQKEKHVISRKVMNHMEQAMKDLVNKKTSQQSFEKTVYQSVKELEVNGNYTKNDPITRASCKQFVDEIFMHAKNWVHVARGKNALVSFNPGVLGAAMDTYLRSPVAFRQFRNDSCFIQPSPSLIQKIKSQKQITDGFCPDICIPQKTYRGTGTIKWDQIRCDEINLTRGIKVNVKTDKMDGMSKDFRETFSNSQWIAPSK